MRIATGVWLGLIVPFLCPEMLFAQQVQGHWLVGVWEGTAGRIIEVTAVQLDGTAQGTMGISPQDRGKAEIRIEGTRVHVVNAIKSVFDLTLTNDERLTGTATSGRDGKVSEYAFTKRKQCTEPIPTDTQSFGPPKYCLLDTWTFSNGRVQRVVKVENDTVVMTGPGISGPCPGCFFYFDRNLTLQKVEREDGKAIDGVTLGFVPIDWKFWDFPLELKKGWSFFGQSIHTGTPLRYRVGSTVEAYEDVKIKAGTFRVFRIRRDWAAQEASRGRDSTWSQTYWFAPEVKQIVKFASTRDADKEWELVSYSLK